VWVIPNSAHCTPCRPHQQQRLLERPALQRKWIDGPFLHFLSFFNLCIFNYLYRIKSAGPSRNLRRWVLSFIMGLSYSLLLYRGVRAGGVVVDARGESPIIDMSDSGYRGRGASSSRVVRKDDPEDQPLCRTRSRRPVRRFVIPLSARS
jgi:hypothetical protein